jgi:hypothetical protein
MKTFEISCIIYDKLTPSNELDEIVELSLVTSIASESQESALEILQNSFHVKEIISILEIL